MCTSDHFCLYTSICDNSSAARTACSDAVNLCKGASSVCLSLSSNAQACRTSDWKFERKLPKENMAQHKQSLLQVFAFFACNAAFALDRSSKSACSALLSWTCEHLVQTTANSVDEMHDVFICDAAVIFPSTRYTNLQGSHKTNSKTDWWLNMRKQELHNQRRKSAPVKLLWPLPQPCVTNKWSL